MPDAIFGSLIDGAAVERAVVDTLKRWLPEYLPWIERKTGRRLRTPGSYVATTDPNRWPEEQLPSILVMNTGLANPPEKNGRRSYRATFAVGVAVVVSAKDYDSTKTLAQLYTAAVRAVLLHHPDLGGLADAVVWVDEGYDALPDGKRARKLASGQAIFNVEVPDVVTALAGPSDPRPDPSTPYPDDPTVTDVRADIEPEAL